MQGVRPRRGDPPKAGGGAPARGGHRSRVSVVRFTRQRQVQRSLLTLILIRVFDTVLQAFEFFRTDKTAAFINGFGVVNVVFAITPETKAGHSFPFHVLGAGGSRVSLR